MPPKARPSPKRPRKSSKQPLNWATAHKRSLIPELTRRDLPTRGNEWHRSVLTARLQATDSPSLRTPSSRRKAHQEQLQHHLTTALENVIPFSLFTHLPFEIRERIWEFSLPGPRVVTLDTDRQSLTPEQLPFSRAFEAKHPVQLRTCREARTVAKRRYQLAFGSRNVYFDFDGGDILYFGPESQAGTLLDQGWGWPPVSWPRLPWEPRAENLLPGEALRRDLERVRHVAIAKNLWAGLAGYAYFSYSTVGGRDNAYGDVLRRRLRQFKALERVSFEYGLERLEDPVEHSVFCGNWVVEDPWFEKRPFDSRIKNVNGQKLDVGRYKEVMPKIEEWLERDGKWQVTGDLAAVALLSRWDTKDLSEEEMEKGVPEARLVDIKFVADEPRRVREKV